MIFHWVDGEGLAESLPGSQGVAAGHVQGVVDVNYVWLSFELRLLLNLTNLRFKTGYLTRGLNRNRR